MKFENIEVTRELEPREIPLLLQKAFVLVSLFFTIVGSIPLTIPQLLIKIPKLLVFFREARPYFEEIKSVIKD